MFLTRILRLKAKTKYIMVDMESIATGHKRMSFRHKQDGPKEIIAFDPLLNEMTLYKELKKVKTVRGNFKYSEDILPEFDEDGNVIQPRTTKKRIPTL